MQEHKILSVVDSLVVDLVGSYVHRQPYELHSLEV